MKKLSCVLLVIFGTLISCNESGSPAATTSDTRPEVSTTAILSGLGATDGNNSKVGSAARMLDGFTYGGATESPDETKSWEAAGNPWNNTGFPMVAYIDLKNSVTLNNLQVFIGNIPFATTAKLEVASTTAASINAAADPNTDTIAWSVAKFITPNSNQYKQWSTPLVMGNNARYLRLIFRTFDARFNITEIRVDATTSTGGTTGTIVPNSAPGTDPLLYTAAQQTTWLDGRYDPPTTLVASGAFSQWPQANQTALINECPKEVHNRYWVRGPDNNLYPTWHPDKTTYTRISDNTVVTCWFGHEHGDDPRPSRFYAERSSTYNQQFQDRLIPMPFGYANEVQKNNPAPATAARIEDHVGHKIWSQKFELAWGNGADASGQLVGTGEQCDALIKLHMGTHGEDALANHLHEMVTHIHCGSGTTEQRVHLTTLTPLGRPGWFSSPCYIDNRSGLSEQINNVRALDQLGNLKTAIPATPVADQDAAHSHFVRDVVPNDFGLNIFPDGERIIPSAKSDCFSAITAASAAGFANAIRYYGGSTESWVVPQSITNGAANSPVQALFRPYINTHNPSRLQDSVAMPDNISRAAKLLPTVEACRIIAGTKPGGCNAITATTTQQDIVSPFKGTVRSVSFKGIFIVNTTSQTTHWTNAYGKTTTNTDPKFAIKQYVSNYNMWSQKDQSQLDRAKASNFGADLTTNIDPTRRAASIPTTNASAASQGFCPALSLVTLNNWRVFAPRNTTSSCQQPQLADNKQFMFSTQWWRDYSALENIHAPN